MPRSYITFRNAFLVLLIAWVCIPYPTGLDTDEVIASTGLVRTLTILCDWVGLPQEHRRFGPVCHRYPTVYHREERLIHALAFQDLLSEDIEHNLDGTKRNHDGVEKNARKLL